MNSAHTRTLDIRSPEGAALVFAVAGPATRFAAWLIDLTLCLCTQMAVNAVLLPRLAMSEGTAQGASAGLFFGLPVVYGIAFEGLWRGQTPGKRLLRLRVMDAGGMPLRVRQVAMRNLLRLVDALPQFYLVGGVVCFITARTQRLGDLAAGTVVVRKERRDTSGVDIALQALLRRDTLTPVRRLELFSGIASRFRLAGQFPGVASEGLTDEQFVHDVVDILLNSPPVHSDPDSPRVNPAALPPPDSRVP